LRRKAAEKRRASFRCSWRWNPFKSKGQEEGEAAAGLKAELQKEDEDRDEEGALGKR